MKTHVSQLDKRLDKHAERSALLEIQSPADLGFDTGRLSCLKSIIHRYVDEGKSAGIVTLLARRGAVVHLEKYGYQNLEEKKPIAFDTLFRIYSMTKPVTSVAFMMLYEQGLIRLEDPVHKYIPEFKSVKVVEMGGKLVAPNQDVRIKHLLTHTAGLGYGDQKDSLVDKLYARANLEEEGINNEEFIRRLADLPLRFHPGESWHYSYATDVIGYLVELLSGVSLSEFMEEKIFLPLRMVDTFFRVPETSKHRLSELYGYTEDKFLQVIDTSTGGNFFEARRDSGGGGLVSTITDYFRFAQCMLNKGELEGARLLGPRTVDLMRTNHLPASMLPIVMEEPWPGIGFGLGFSVVVDITQSDQRGSVGSHGWGGWASTHFWIDPIEEIIGIIMLQYIPSRTFPLTNDFRNAVYQALIDNRRV